MGVFRNLKKGPGNFSLLHFRSQQCLICMIQSANYATLKCFFIKQRGLKAPAKYVPVKARSEQTKRTELKQQNYVGSVHFLSSARSFRKRACG